MIIFKRKIFLSVIAMLLLVACGPTNSSISEELSSNHPSTSDSSSEGGTIVGTPIQPGEVPAFIDIYFNPGNLNFYTYQLWLWDEGGTDGKAYNWDNVVGDWAVYRVDTSKFKTVNGLNLLVKSKDTWSYKTPDSYIRYTNFGHVDGVLSVYTIIGDGNMLEFYSLASDALGDRIISADFKSFKTIEVVSTASPLSYQLYVDGVFEKLYAGSGTSQIITLDRNIELHKRYEIYATYASHNKTKIKIVSPRHLYKTNEFQSAYTYTGNDLGVTYTPTSSTFKLWAPTSSNVRLNLYLFGTNANFSGDMLDDVPYKRFNMSLGAKGVWSVTVNEDLNLKFYTYTVTNSNGVSEVADPYAKSAGVNGIRGQVLDFDRYESESFKNIDAKLAPISSPTDLVIYEMHVQDLTWDQTWNGDESKRGKYLGLIEEGTTYTSGATTITTGFDHLKDLGVNAVQIMPFYDQANHEVNKKTKTPDGETIITPPSHNWGYNPLNFNVLEGAYASDAYRGEVRVQEFKQVVEKFADNNIRIIMDVVYNHVANVGSSNFDKIVPYYYFRYEDDWSLNDDSGVGNVFASENAMASKFIVDSVLFWTEEYNIKGFRFDLMQLIDDQTLIDLDKALSEKGFNDVVIYGEPWSAVMGGYVGGYKVNQGTLKNTRVGAFNDVGRNALKGGNNIRNNEHYGYINKGEADNLSNYSLVNKSKAMLAGINGEMYSDNVANNNPKKNVQYAGSHDNFSLFDQMLFSFGGDKNMAMRAATTANSIVLTSIGIPFFQGGDEIGRTKPFDETSEAGKTFLATHFNESAELNGQFYSGNSYNIGYETNRYRWDDKVTYLNYFNAYKDLIHLRLSDKGEVFRIDNATEVNNHFRFWQDSNPKLNITTIASENKLKADSYVSKGAIYSFYVGRLAENDTVKQEFNFGSGQVKVLYDSKGELTGQTISTKLALERYRTVIVERI